MENQQRLYQTYSIIEFYQLRCTIISYVWLLASFFNESNKQATLKISKWELHEKLVASQIILYKMYLTLISNMFL